MTLEGKIRYTLKNDYMFKAVFQKNEKLLKGLLASLLDISMQSITDMYVRNPIVLGESINNKTVILDVLVEMNHNTLVNIEMQVAKEECWAERSLTYLSKEFSHLEVGDSYDKVMTTIHIGILDFELFEGETIFYSRNMLMDMETHRIYSRKLGLNVLCLKNIEHATQRDRDSELYRWARLFAADTWEELKSIAENDVVMEDVVMAIAELSEDEKIRIQCEAREKYEIKVRLERAAVERKRRELEQKLAEANARAEEANARAEEANARAAQLEAELERRKSELETLKK